MRSQYRLEQLSKHFPGVLAVDAVRLVIAPGEAVAVIGPSGAGKTTLFRLLNLTLRPTGGRLHVGGEDAGRLRGRRLREVRRRIGTIYQQHNLIGRLRVVHNVLAGHLGRWSFPHSLRSLLRPSEAELREAHQALARVGIPEKLWARTDELSGGQQQRVAIARVLLQDPEVILADEPVSSVDPTLARSIVHLLLETCRERGKTLVMNLHTVDLALATFPRVVGFREGHVVFDRPAVDVSGELIRALYAGVHAGLARDRSDVIPRITNCAPILRPQ